MNRNVIAIIASVVAIAAILAGTYGAFFALAAQIPAGRTLGILGAAMMVGSGLARAGVGHLASRWARRTPPAWPRCPRPSSSARCNEHRVWVPEQA